MTKFIVTRSRLVWQQHEVEVEAENDIDAIEVAEQSSDWELVPDSGHGESEPVEEKYHVEKHFDEKSVEERSADGAY